MEANHPECPGRLKSINNIVLSSNFNVPLKYYDAPLATHEQLCGAHDSEYVNQIFSNAPQVGVIRLDQDTTMNSHSLNAVLRASGAVVLGVDLVMTRQKN